MDQRKAQDIVPPFSLLESVDIMLQVAKAMCFLHRKEVAHRDLKCQNILWKHGQFDQLVVKLGDFGEAKTDVKNSTMNHNKHGWWGLQVGELLNLVENTCSHTKDTH